MAVADINVNKRVNKSLADVVKDLENCYSHYRSLDTAPVSICILINHVHRMNSLAMDTINIQFAAA